MEWSERVAVVTGANSGIGLAVTKHLLGLGMTVVGVDKNIEQLQKVSLSEEKLDPVEVDLTQEVQITRLFSWLESRGGLDVLVNNAGLGGVSSLLEGKPAEWRRLLDVNVLALTQCAVEAIRLMRKSNIKHGQIINITSNLAHYVSPFPVFHFYSATKHAVRALTEGLRQELREIQPTIRISSVSPGLVKTDIFKSSVGEKVEKVIYDNYPSMEANDVAAAVEFILSTPQHVNINEIGIRPTGSEN